MSDLSRLAGGDDHELAVHEIRQGIERARRSLLEQHPFFQENHECADSSPAA